MPLWVWSPLSYVALILVAPWYAWKLIRTEKYREGFWQRLTLFTLDEVQALQGGPCVWVHAVSVGELQAARPLLQALRETYPDVRIVVSTVTRTGQALARDSDLVDASLYLPLDVLPLCRRALAMVNPRAVLILETELWPNFLRAVHERSIPFALVNARLSDASFRAYSLATILFRSVLRLLPVVVCQGERDQQRFVSLGADASAVHPLGNIKFDAPIPSAEDDVRARWRRLFSINDDELLLVAGSTFAGEEELICRVVEHLQAQGIALRVVIAPRHIERIADLVPRLPDTVVLRSTLHPDSPGRQNTFFLLDTLGELGSLYAAADVVFMGKSICAKGGQNPIEPASWKCPILTGTHTANFRDVYALFAEADAVSIVKDEQTLQQTLVELCTSEERRVGMGERALDVVERNRGALTRTMNLLAPLLDDAFGKKAADG